MSDRSLSVPLTNAHTPAFGLAPGPITEVHAFWLAGMSCDGCSIAAVGAQHPSVEQLISGSIPGMPKVVLHHPVLAVEAGETFITPYRLAREGKLGAPYVVIYEGSVADERIAYITAATGRRWAPITTLMAACGRSPPRNGCTTSLPARQRSSPSALAPPGAASRQRPVT